MFKRVFSSIKAFFSRVFSSKKNVAKTVHIPFTVDKYKHERKRGAATRHNVNGAKYDPSKPLGRRHRVVNGIVVRAGGTVRYREVASC